MTYPPFQYRQTSRWRCVDLKTTMMIAHRCSSGVNFQGDSKSDIFQSMAKPHGFTTQPEKFEAMMNEAAKLVPELESAYRQSLRMSLEIFEDQYQP